MGNISSVDSIKNISKVDTKLSKEFKENTSSIYQIKLKDHITILFNPTAAVIEHQEKHLR